MVCCRRGLFFKLIIISANIKIRLQLSGANASGLIFSWVSGRLLFGVFGFIPTGIGGPTTVLTIVATVLFFRGRGSVG